MKEIKRKYDELPNKIHCDLEKNFIKKAQSYGYRQFSCAKGFGRRPDILMYKRLHTRAGLIYKVIWGEVLISNLAGFPSQSEVKHIISNSKKRVIRLPESSTILISFILIQKNATFILREVEGGVFNE